MRYSYLCNLIWALCLLLSFSGWGALLALVLPREPRRVWAMQATYGMAVVILGGELLMFFACARPGFLFPLVIVGTLVGIADAAGRFAMNRRRVSLFEAAFFVVGLLLVATTVVWRRNLDPNDDLIAYFTFPQVILDTGTLMESYSLRRAVTFGGQSFLHALVLLGGSERNLHVIDMGIAKLLIWALVLGTARSLRFGTRSMRALFVVLALFVILLPAPRINTTSVNTSILFLLAVLLHLRSTRASLPARWRDALPLALLIAAASTFRPHIGPVAVTFFLAWLTTEVCQRRVTLGAAASATLRVGVLTAAFLVPASALLYRACGTPMFPPFLGWVDPTFAAMHATRQSFAAATSVVLQFLAAPQLALLFAVAVLPLVFLRVSARLAILVVALAFTILTAYSTTALVFGYYYRYVFPLPAALLFWSLARAGQEAASPEQRGGLTPALWASSVLGAVFLCLPGLAEARALFSSLPQQIVDQRPALPPEYRDEYVAFQKEVPSGAGIFAMVDEPFLLDYTRNRIINIDMPGAISPHRAMPYFKGPSALRDYLTRLNVGYVMFVRPERALMFYRRNYWVNHPRPEKFYKEVWAPPMLDLMDNLEALRKTAGATVIKEDPSYVLLRISSP